MKVLIFGASGMTGKGVLRASFADPKVELALAVGRSTAPDLEPLNLRLRRMVHRDLMIYQRSRTS